MCQQHPLSQEHVVHRRCKIYLPAVTPPVPHIIGLAHRTMCALNPIWQMRWSMCRYFLTWWHDGFANNSHHYCFSSSFTILVDNVFDALLFNGHQTALLQCWPYKPYTVLVPCPQTNLFNLNRTLRISVGIRQQSEHHLPPLPPRQNLKEQRNGRMS